MVVKPQIPKLDTIKILKQLIGIVKKYFENKKSKKYNKKHVNIYLFNIFLIKITNKLI